ncbi:hypothetical protein [Rhodocytophaga rosea]|uniref:hypothetical protein n=1 Tax=Rhodocytophaga rosea TaxID=2704465 RepID=UPI001E2DA54D|nr:hypothetical protein [Rhodocytophaga rosea]
MDNMYRYLLLLFFPCTIFVSAVAQTPLTLKNSITAGYEPSFFDDLGKRMADSIPSLGSLVVWTKGGIVYENYFHGASATTTFNIKSITKSVVSAMAGIAQSKNYYPPGHTGVAFISRVCSAPRAFLIGVVCSRKASGRFVAGTVDVEKFTNHAAGMGVE